MKVISEIRNARCDSLEALRDFIMGEIHSMQRDGLEVDVQYSAVDKYNYTALLLGYHTLDR